MADALSLDAINELLSEARTRGAYEKDVRTFFESGDLAFDFTDKYPTKESGSLRNSVTQNVKKLIADKSFEVPSYQVVMAKNGDENKPHVILINMDAYTEQQGNS